MIIKKKLVKINKKKKINLTIGTFDAFHIGHIKVLETLINTSKDNHSQSCVITFQNRPKLQLKHQNDGIILPNEYRINFFKKLGIDYLFYLKFNQKLAEIKAEDFLKMLNNLFNLNKIIIGKDFKFGYRNQGNIMTLKKNRKKFNFQLKIIKEEKFIKQKISTTLIKSLIKEGKIIKANKLLSRKYFFNGKVVKGSSIGKTIGFPTVNLKLLNKKVILPSYGVYVTVIKYLNTIYKGMTFIGINNFNKRFVIETNIFNFNNNIYKKKISIFLIKKLRKEIKFIRLEDLKKQLALDKKKALQIIKKLVINKRLL